MVFVDKKGKKYEIQYCVIIRGEENAGFKNYLWTTKEKIQEIIKGYKFSNKGESIIKVGHISGHERGKIEDEIYINKNKLGSLEIRAKDRDSAKKIIEFLGLSVS